MRNFPPRRTGPWKVIEVLTNGVNFKIENELGEQKVVHHNHLSPVRNVQNTEVESSHGSNSDGESDEQPPRRYPLRDRRQTQFYGAVRYESDSE